MAILRATVVLTTNTAKEEDASRNVWHVSTPAAITTAEMNAVGDGLGVFYGALSNYLGQTIKRATTNAHRVELAQVNQGGAGEADDVVTKLLATRFFTIGNVASNDLPLPPQAAAALSFRGDITGLAEEESGGLVRPASRRRGRVFIGPLKSNVMDQETSSLVPIFTGAFVTSLLNQYQTLSAAFAAAGVNHIVYSRASAGAYKVVQVSADYRPDTVRRRATRSNVARATAAVTPAF